MSSRKWTRKSTTMGIVASIGIMLLPRHQPQKESYCDWYKRAVDSLTHRDNCREARLESPDFRRRRLTVSTREGSGRGRPPWNRWKWGWRRRQSHGGSVRGGWVSRRRRSANQAFSGQRGAIRVWRDLGSL